MPPLTQKEIDDARSRFFPGIKVRQKTIGLGDAVAAVATPIARALRLPCIDPATKQLRPESGCAKRKARLNALTQMQPPTEPPAV